MFRTNGTVTVMPNVQYCVKVVGKNEVLTCKQNINWQFVVFLQFLRFTMLSENDNDGNDQSSNDNSSGDDDEMIHTTASKKEVRN